MGTVAKAMSLLALFSENQLEYTLSEVAQVANMDKATAYRLLTALRDAGLIERFSPDKFYRIGPEALRLANVREKAVPFMTAAKRAVKTLCNSVSETTHVSLLRGNRLSTMAHYYSQKHAMSILMGDTDSYPLHATSSGLTTLAFSNPTFIESVLSKPLEQFTENTMTSPETIRQKIQKIKHSGFSASIGGYEADVHSFAAAIFNKQREPIGAIAIAAPTSRINEKNHHNFPYDIVNAAINLTREIGGALPVDYPMQNIQSV